METSSDFGVRSAPASHPELLDPRRLVCEKRMVDQAVEPLHHAFKNLATISVDRPALRGMDPDNRLLWRKTAAGWGLKRCVTRCCSSRGSLITTPAAATGEGPDDTANRRRTCIHSSTGKICRTFFVCSIFRARTFPRRAARGRPCRSSRFPVEQPFVLARARPWLSVAARPFAALYRATLGREPEPEELRLAKRFVAQSGCPRRRCRGRSWRGALLSGRIRRD